MRFLFCYMEGHFVLGIAAMCLWLVFLLVALTTVTLKFYKPTCLLLAKNLNMSPQLAGLTILLFGNNASEAIVPAFRYHNDTEIVFAEIMGVAIYLVTFVCGLSIILRPFLLIRSLVITACLIHLTTAALIALSFEDEYMSIGEVFMYYLLYGIYLFAIFFGYAVLSKRSVAMRVKTRPRLAPFFSGTRQEQHDVKNLIFTSTLEILDDAGESFDVDQSQACGFKGTNASDRLFEQFFKDLQRVCFKDFELASVPQKIRQIAMCPITISLMLCIPMCNAFLPMHGWGKLRFIFNIFCYPLLVMTTVGREYI
jgi:Ca2+/Na+ antiporter